MSHAMDISRITSYMEKLPKNLKNGPYNRKKWNFQKNVKSLQFLMVQGPLNPNITFLGEKL